MSLESGLTNESPKESSSPNVSFEKITPERIKNTWDTLNMPEKRLIISTGDKEFAEMIEGLELETAKKWALFRILIKAKSPLIYAMIQGQKMEPVEAGSKKEDKIEKNTGKTETSAGKDKLLDLGFKESEDKTFFYTRLEGPYRYENGVAAARSKFKVDIKYPSEEQALALLNKFKAEFPEKAVAAFINEENAFVYLSKTGNPGKFKSNRVPGDTELFVIVVTSQK